uniref:Uncharacterized protein n=1 Tax=Anguilla anguilla TaxID=7936 RepID=A0A0E9TM16_ANGAN
MCLVDGGQVDVH